MRTCDLQRAYRMPQRALREPGAGVTSARETRAEKRVPWAEVTRDEKRMLAPTLSGVSLSGIASGAQLVRPLGLEQLGRQVVPLVCLPGRLVVTNSRLYLQPFSNLASTPVLTVASPSLAHPSDREWARCEPRFDWARFERRRLDFDLA